jgi:hypothetical protein
MYTFAIAYHVTELPQDCSMCQPMKWQDWQWMCFNDFIYRLCPVIGFNRISSLLRNEHTHLLGSEIISSTFSACHHQVTLSSVQISVPYTDRILYQGTECWCPYIYIKSLISYIYTRRLGNILKIRYLDKYCGHQKQISIFWYLTDLWWLKKIGNDPRSLTKRIWPVHRQINNTYWTASVNGGHCGSSLANVLSKVVQIIVESNCQNSKS